MLSRLIRYVGTSSVSVSVSVSSSIIIPNNNKLFPPPRPFVSYLIRSFSSSTITEPLYFNLETLDHFSAIRIFDLMLDYDGFYSISDFNFLFSSLIKKGCLLTVFQLAQRWEESLSRKCYDRVYPNIDTWKILISCHSKKKSGNISFAFSLFHRIIEDGHRPTTSTLNDIFRGLCLRGQIYKAIMFYNYTILKGFQLNLETYSIIIHGLCKIGETKKAIHFLREAPQIHKEQNNGLCEIGETKIPFHFLSEAEQEEDEFEDMYDAIIITLCMERHINEAYDLFSEMIVKKKIIPCNDIYCCLVYGYCITGQFKQAIALFREFGEALRIRNIGALDTEHIQDVKAAKFVTEQEVTAAKRAVAVLIKRGVKPDLASCQSVVGGLYNGGTVKVTRKMEELSLRFSVCFLENHYYLG
ncbi:putative pentatricopeptide [Medicago truncatula]|uniref:PPR superfamily protein n=1 Tax=Medicago truncatula TaxID=3880 RepID=A0A072VRM3_MEDTR|nr:PPR superfamily protein [Medicago truncatula]RHN78177.1 putative pentatricopeptide [Medicago truncatula]